MKTLNETAIGTTVTVVKINGEKALKRKLMDMGITKGTSIFIRKSAPLKDPIEVNVRNYELSIRRKEAMYIEVE
ncbi:MAG: ferrous iron transport protein A [Erysipelotrichaceae bacterium]|nr:ferrous iron transport protein A [Erysipelotrichaceae bacterium]MDD3924770.1 ferrous iron transport protein A [Erysipelotrichaceae bacterium]MDD4643285.1 ferrous iron transport protein A [Erysipelotrichaceae bacterium]